MLTDQKIPLFLPTHPRGVSLSALRAGPMDDDGFELKGEWIHQHVCSSSPVSLVSLASLRDRPRSARAGRAADTRH